MVIQTEAVHEHHAIAFKNSPLDWCPPCSWGALNTMLPAQPRPDMEGGSASDGDLAGESLPQGGGDDLGGSPVTSMNCIPPFPMSGLLGGWILLHINSTLL